MSSITCPYCMKTHFHEPQQPEIHHESGCDDNDRYGGLGISIGGRFFVPNYGYDIYKYRESGKVNELIAPVEPNQAVFD
jgi:hypothetical protein